MSTARAPKTHPNQWAVLVDFLLEHTEMVTKTFVGMDAREKYKKLWEEAATQLNSMGFGCKTAEKWIEAFSKWKSKVKVKAQNIKLNMTKTGGGEPLPPLTPVENKLMGIIGWTIVEGDATQELGFENNDARATTSQQAVQNETANSTNQPHSPDTQMSTSEVCKIPSLVAINTKARSMTMTLATPSTTNLEDTPKEGRHKEEGKPLLKKRRVAAHRKGDEMTLLRMHQENLVVLNNINENLAKLANGQEAFLNRVHVCPQCSKHNKENM